MTNGSPNDGKPMQARRVIQITDCHLEEEAGRIKRGCDPDASLAAVLDEAGRWRPDAVVATGDLTDEGEPAAYDRLRTHLSALGVPVYAIPGNHDHRERMQRFLCGGSIRCVDEVALDGWRLLLLDSTIPGEPGGRIDDAALAALPARAAERPNLVFVHHPPIGVESPWIDAMGMANGEALLAALGGTATRAIACGHVHHVYTAGRGALQVLTAPATSFQARPRRTEFQLDTLAPGFRWFDLYPDGSWRSGVRRVALAHTG